MLDNNRVQFDEPKGRILRGPRQSWPTKLIMKYGLAKDEKQASIVLVVIVILAVVITIIAWPRPNGTINPRDIIPAIPN